MKRNWILISILIIILLATWPFVFGNKNPQVIINDKTINVELAKTDTERAQGLMYRDHLDINSGMLFVFPSTDIYQFYMKNTLIPLDIIWIDDNKIVEITTLQPQNGDNIPSYTPTQKANYVLEVNANSGFEVGDEVKIKN